MRARLPRIHKPEGVTLISARLWDSDYAKLRKLAKEQQTTFSALFRAVVRSGITAIIDELSQQPNVIGATTIGDEDDPPMVEREIDQLKATFRNQCKAVQSHFANTLLPERVPGETLRSCTTRRWARHGVSFLNHVDHLLKYYENAPFDEDDERAVVVGKSIINKAREWELNHIGRSAVPCPVLPFKRFST